MRAQLQPSSLRRLPGLCAWLASAPLAFGCAVWAADTNGPALEKPPQIRLAFDTCLADHELGLAETVFRKTEPTEKVSRTVLRVFFRQADACVVTRESFETMGELNPQLRKELRVLATSPEVVPSVFFFRPGFTGHLREEMESSIATLHETVAGRQALTVFQGDKLGQYPLTCLNTASELLAAAARLKKTEPPQVLSHASLPGPPGTPSPTLNVFQESRR